MNPILLRIFFLMVALCPIRDLRDFYHRWELAESIAYVTSDVGEENTLARIAWFESGYSDRVARCEDLGYPGNISRGAFQVTGQTPYDRLAACGSLSQQAEVALRYVRRSADACPQNEGAAKLAFYVSGHCNRGLAKAKERWGAP